MIRSSSPGNNGDIMELVEQILYNLLEVHPIHTLTVHFPIALTTSALFFMAMAVWRNSRQMEQVAFANIALATLSTAVAGMTGWLDNREVYDGEAPNASVKIVLAIVLLLVTLSVTVARWRNSDLFYSRYRRFYIAGYLTSFALVAVLGFLGGVILYGFEKKPSPESLIPVTGHNFGPAQPSPSATISTADSAPGVSFSNQILPIFKSRCTNCHGGQKLEEGLNLTSYSLLMSGSENGFVIIPGDGTASVLVTSLVERKMPKRGPKLSPEQIQLIIDWINEGALDN